MNDLISRKALIAEYDRVHIGPPGGARKLMEDAPSVDAVEVVRCKDCKHWRDASKPLYCSHYMGDCTLDDEPVHRWERDFCSYGERKTEN